MKFRELDNICEYGLMGFNIDEAIENKNINPEVWRVCFNRFFNNNDSLAKLNELSNKDFEG